MSKVLISLLGTGRSAKGDNNKNIYATTDYTLEGRLYPSETLVANAMIAHYGIDRLFVIGTAESMWDNLAEIFESDDEVYYEILRQKEKKTLTQDSLNDLNNSIVKKLGSAGSKCFLVIDGKSKNELWDIFGSFIEILDLLNDGDEVYFDITHLFRSHSIMSFVMSQFGQTYKKFKIAGFFYGMLVKDEPSPIINLREFYKFAEWSNAINMLNSYGNGDSLKMLLNDSDESKEIKNAFSEFSDALSIADMGSMQQSFKRLAGQIKAFENSNNHIVKILSKQLVRFIKRFDVDESLSKFQFQLAKWYAESANYAMAYITLTEAAISVKCEVNGYDSTKKDDRDKAKKELFSLKDWKSSLQEQNKIGNAFSKVSNIRKNIAHKISANSVDRGSKSSPKNSVENFDNYFATLSKIGK
ncbi:MAG: TIGR02221 family CRISPR-associated protein [Helicobacteraceae bacterium]|jgi:CRISPR-associated Csx2 family protein|nr:TIGR02221 family CRISPR-associated protein [Helicobacteraceae bacterium]